MHRPTLFTFCSALSLAVALSACSIGPGASPKARDAEGRPVFDQSLVRHPANEPYFCFSLVTSGGDEVSQCRVIKDFCVGDLREARERQQPILSGCRAVDQVSCYVAYATGAMLKSSRAMCWETPEHCQTMNAVSMQQMGATNVSPCGVLDRSFQPVE